MKRTQAFSLIETLIVIVVITILAALLFPVISSSKRAAVKTDDLSKLRQLGQAAAMYEDRYGVFPLGTGQLVEAGMVPRELCVSVRDTTAFGFANEVAQFTDQRLRSLGTSAPTRPYKNSFVGLEEFGLTHYSFDKYVTNGPAGGWLIDVGDSERTEFPTPTAWNGSYRRLLTDGSVVTRQITDFECYNGGEAKPCRMPVLMFVDPSPYFVELQKSNGSSSSSVQPSRSGS
jgi:prepilin-type N-terminal cleavage/methylation domain-containing protein